MQQQPQMIPVMPSFPPTNITTEQIQKYLDDHKMLVVAILGNQNLGKLTECAHYQTLLQKYLIYLAAVADSTMSPQVAAHHAMQAGGYYMNILRQQQWLSNQESSPKRCHYNSISPINYRILNSSYTNKKQPCKHKWE